MDVVLIVFAMIILLLLQGFFSGSEIALVNVDKIHMRAKASQGSRGAQLVLNLFKRPEVLLTTTLVGTNVSVVTLTALGTVLMIRWFGDVGELYSVMVFTPLLLIFGEVVPKSVYQQRADQFAPVVVYPLRAFKFIFYPIIFGFSLVARLAAKLAGQPISPQSLFITRQQLRTVVEMAERGANVDVFDQMRIKRAIRFANTTVGEAMVPIAEMVEHRIRAYPIDELEKLIWTVTRRELKLIIYLGGFLGAVVGALMVVIQVPTVGLAYLGVIVLASYLFLNFR